MDPEKTDATLREAFRLTAPGIDEGLFMDDLRAKLASARRPRRPSRRLRIVVIACAALVLLAGISVGVLEATTHLGRHSTVLVITDQPGSTEETTTTSLASPTSLFSNPYPPGSALPSVDQAPAGPYPRHRDSTWAQELGKAILAHYPGKDWKVVSANEYVEPLAHMVIQIEPQSGNARIGSDGLSNANLEVGVLRQEGTLPISLITQNGTIPSANLATGFGSGIVISKPLMNLAYFRRPDQLQVNVDAGLLRQNEAPYQTLLDQDGVAELAEFVASIIQMTTQTRTIDESTPTTEQSPASSTTSTSVVQGPKLSWGEEAVLAGRTIKVERPVEVPGRTITIKVGPSVVVPDETGAPSRSIVVYIAYSLVTITNTGSEPLTCAAGEFSLMGNSSGGSGIAGPEKTVDGHQVLDLVTLQPGESVTRAVLFHIEEGDHPVKVLLGTRSSTGSIHLSTSEPLASWQ